MRRSISELAQTSWSPLLAFALLLLAHRLLVVAFSINDLHVIYPVEAQQLQLARDVLEDHLGLHNLLSVDGQARYLPAGRQFHGVLLLNNILLLLISSLLGIHYYNAHLLVIGYLILGYLCWARLLQNHFGARAWLLFSLLYLFVPKGYLCAGLYLEGSHPEGLAIFALMYLLAFPKQGTKTIHLFFFLAGLFFFLYKPMLLVFLILVFPALLQLPSWHKRGMGLLLLAAGFVPVVLYYLHYGFYSQYLQDSVHPDNGPTWFNSLSPEHFNFRAWRLPPTALSLFQSDSPFQLLYPLLFIAAWLFLIFVLIKTKREKASSLTLPAILLFPLLYLLLLSILDIPLAIRYYLPLYPFMVLVLSLSLARLPVKIMRPLTLLLVLALLPDNLGPIKPSRGFLFLHYPGDLFIARHMNYVPADELDQVNRRFHLCPSNRGFQVLYRLAADRQFGVTDADIAPQRLAKHIKNVLENQSWKNTELTALGIGLSLRTKGDVPALRDFLQVLHQPLEAEQQIALGFRRAPYFLARGICLEDAPGLVP